MVVGLIFGRGVLNTFPPPYVPTVQDAFEKVRLVGLREGLKKMWIYPHLVGQGSGLRGGQNPQKQKKHAWKIHFKPFSAILDLLLFTLHRGGVRPGQPALESDFL